MSRRVQLMIPRQLSMPFLPKGCNCPYFNFLLHITEFYLTRGFCLDYQNLQITYVTGFAKTLQLHTSDFSTLVTHNSRTIKDIAVKFLHIVKQ